MHEGIAARLPSGAGENLGFGTYIADRMLVQNYNRGSGWGPAKVVSHGELAFDPSALGLHYGAGVFEGLKAYAQPDGPAALFRPQAHARRFKRSARLMALPELPEEQFVSNCIALVRDCQNWVPRRRDTALYLRPLMLAMDSGFGIRAAETAQIVMTASPVEPIRPLEGARLSLRVSTEAFRSPPGGYGDVKTIGNYGRTARELISARSAGYDNVLWIDCIDRRFIEEAGISNVFVRTGNTIQTPPCNGRILPGVTRDSVLTIARSQGFEVREEEIDIARFLAGIESGQADEMFVSGTAMSIQPVGRIGLRGRDTLLPQLDDKHSASQQFRTLLGAIQSGVADDTFGWMTPCTGSSKPEHATIGEPL